MRTAFIANQGMNFINNQSAGRLQHAAAAFTSQKNVKRFRRSDADMRWSFGHRRTLGCRRIARAHESAYIHCRQTKRFQFLSNAFKRFL